MAGVRQVASFVWTHPSNRGHQLWAMMRAVRWQLHKRLRSTPWDLPIYNGMHLRCYPNSRGAGISVYSSGWQDFDAMFFAARYLRPGDSMLDIGANIGVYALLAAARVGSEGCVVAFEPGEKAYRRLVENIALNGLGQVDARSVAVAPHAGHIRFHQGRDVANRIYLEEDLGDDRQQVSEVPCVTLGEVLAERPFALGKMDIEGGEPLVLEASHVALEQHPPPVWLMEFKPRLLQKFGWSGPQFAKFLEAVGYELGTYCARENRLALGIDPEQEEENVVVVHQRAVDITRERLASAHLPAGFGPMR